MPGTENYGHFPLSAEELAEGTEGGAMQRSPKPPKKPKLKNQFTGRTLMKRRSDLRDLIISTATPRPGGTRTQNEEEPTP